VFHLAILLLTLAAALAPVELEVLRVVLMALAVFALVAPVAALAVLCRMRLWASSTKARPSQ